MSDLPQLPIPEADPKPWYRSQTILSGLAAILSGLAGMVLALIGQAPAETLVPSITTVLSGISVLRGRVSAEQPIARQLLPRL